MEPGIHQSAIVLISTHHIGSMFHDASSSHSTSRTLWRIRYTLVAVVAVGLSKAVLMPCR